jgi:hypothetical protein
VVASAAATGRTCSGLQFLGCGFMAWPIAGWARAVLVAAGSLMVQGHDRG